MLFKKFGSDIYQKTNPEYKTYQTDNGKETMAITKNYTVLKQVGDGATSVVVKACRNKDINDAVAIKKVKRVFEHTAFAHRAMRELRLLRCLGNHENVSFSLKCTKQPIDH
jgi:serine/threonine protein kinase